MQVLVLGLVSVLVKELVEEKQELGLVVELGSGLVEELWVE